MRPHALAAILALCISSPALAQAPSDEEVRALVTAGARSYMPIDDRCLRRPEEFPGVVIVGGWSDEIESCYTLGAVVGGRYDRVEPQTRPALATAGFAQASAERQAELLIAWLAAVANGELVREATPHFGLPHTPRFAPPRAAREADGRLRVSAWTRARHAHRAGHHYARVVVLVGPDGAHARGFFLQDHVRFSVLAEAGR